jgi:uroporphyrinogen decarboxylase
MNKIERFRAVLQGAPVDRVPAGFWFHFDPVYQGGEAMALQHLAFYRATDMDIMKVMNDTGYGPIGKVRIQEPRDWLKLEPTPLSDPVFQSHLSGLRQIVEVIGAEVPIMTTAFNPYHRSGAIVAASAEGPEPLPSAEARAILWQHLRSDPEPVMQGLQVIAEDLAAFYAACITDAGIHGLYYSAQGGERELCSDEEHARYLKTYDLIVLDKAQEVAEFVIGHFCGKAINLERFVDYPVQMANWAHQSENLSLSEGQALFGGLPILGGLDERGPLVYGPREALRQEIEEALAEMGARGFMLGAGCTVPSDVNIGNLIYARDVVAQLSAA